MAKLRTFPAACAAPGCPKVTRERRCPAHAAAYRQQYEATPARREATGKYRTRQWYQLRRLVLVRDPVCRDAAGCTQRSRHVDHIKPLSQGGTDDPGNLQGLCTRHHNRKTANEMMRGEGGRWG